MSMSRHEQTFVMGNDARFKFDAVRNEAAEVWGLNITKEGSNKPILSGAFPANFRTDKRTAKDFLYDLTVTLWPASHAASIAKKNTAWLKKNRRKVM
jgi:hypothetical protein